MPDKWEYPWYAAWDLAFHTIPFARIDPAFAKDQLLLFLREWYMHPNGQIPAYEWNFSDVNPPVHAWATWRVYKMTAKRGERDRAFLESCAFHKLLLNFTWWVNRKDIERQARVRRRLPRARQHRRVRSQSQPLPSGGTHLNRPTAPRGWRSTARTMLAIALELARVDPAYEDVASQVLRALRRRDHPALSR
jgi:hypothetical protein